jgi:hypothetical protein
MLLTSKLVLGIVSGMYKTISITRKINLVVKKDSSQ